MVEHLESPEGVFRSTSRVPRVDSPQPVPAVQSTQVPLTPSASPHPTRSLIPVLAVAVAALGSLLAWQMIVGGSSARHGASVVMPAGAPAPITTGSPTSSSTSSETPATATTPASSPLAPIPEAAPSTVIRTVVVTPPPVVVTPPAVVVTVTAASAPSIDPAAR